MRKHRECFEINFVHKSRTKKAHFTDFFYEVSAFLSIQKEYNDLVYLKRWASRSDYFWWKETTDLTKLVGEKSRIKSVQVQLKCGEVKNSFSYNIIKRGKIDELKISYLFSISLFCSLRVLE